MSTTRTPTKYAGVYYRLINRVGKKGEKEKVFYITFKKDGKKIEEKVGKQYADKMTDFKANAYRSRRLEGKELSPREKREQEIARKRAHESRWTIARLWEEYKKSRTNLKGFVTDENRFKNYLEQPFGEKEPREIIPLDVDRLRIYLLKKKSPGTVKNILELLRRITNYGAKKHLCSALPFSIEMPRVDNLRTEDLAPGELKKLLEAINEEIETNGHVVAANMMLLALYTGLRRGEMFRLKWKHIDFERGFIRIKDPKGGKSQDIPLNESAKNVIQGVIHESEYVFPGRGGNQRADVKRGLNHIKEKADLPKGFRPLHGLRHVYASMLASSGHVDLYTLQKLLTHKSPAMTQRYAHLRDDALRRASDLAGDIIGKVVAEEQTVKMKKN